MNKLGKFLFAITLVSLFHLEAQSKHHEDDMMDMDRKGRFFEELDLTDEQKAKLKEFRQSNKGDFKEAWKGRKELHEKMKDAFIKGASDSEIKSIHEEISAHHKKHADKRIEKMIFLKNTLTEEQRKKFMEKRGRKGRRGRGHRGPRGH